QGALGEVERLAEEGGRCGDRRKLVSTDAEAVEHLRPVDVAKGRRLRELPRAIEKTDRGADVSKRHPCPALGEQRTKLERGNRDGGERNAELVQLGHDFPVLIRLDRGLRASDDALHALALARRDSDLAKR